MNSLFRNLLRKRNLSDVEDLIEVGDNYDAIRNAKMENIAILENSVEDMPQHGEDHETHLKQHKSFYDQLAMLEPDQQPPGMEIMARHIQMTEQMIEQAQQAQATPQQPQQPEMGMEQPADAMGGMAPPAEARTQGEELGDMMGAQAGAEAEIMQ